MTPPRSRPTPARPAAPASQTRPARAETPAARDLSGAGAASTDAASAALGPRPTVVLTAEDLKARTIFDEGGWWAINKPPFLPTVGRSLEDDDCLQFWVMQAARRMVWSAHQLDADTSGVCLFVRNRSLVPQVQARMRHPNGQKTYLAVVHGTPPNSPGRVDAPLGPLPEDPRRQGVTPTGKPASTRYLVLQKTATHSLVALRLETGRTHQIRLHLGHLGLSLVGEAWYRTPICTLHPRQALHAWSMQFRDTAAPQFLVAPLPEDLVQLATALGFDVSALPDPTQLSF